MDQIDAYRVVGELGRGGAAIVYEVSDARGQVFALKLLLRSGARNLARFEREREAMTSLGSQGGFVPVLGAGKCPRGAFIVMPILRGGTLQERLRQGPLPILDVIDLGERLAGALANAHDLGLVHRDLKPANILFDEVGRALIADLGLAKAMDESQDASLSKTGELRGTLGYAPPEQLRDAKRAGPPADVFALGATLYHCLAGCSPFGHDLDAIEKVKSGAVPPIASLRPDSPAWLIAILERCLRSDPSERYADGGALSEAFASASRTPASRGRGAWLLAGLGVVAALLTGGAWALSQGEQPQPSAAPSLSPTPALARTTPAAASLSPQPSQEATPQGSASPELPPLAEPKQSTTLTRDLASFASFEPLSQLSGLEQVQGGVIVEMRSTPTGDLYVADQFGFLRVFSGPELKPRGWSSIYTQDERFDPLPKGIPRLLEISPTGNFALATVDAKTALFRSLDKKADRLVLGNLPGPLLAACFTPDGKQAFLTIGGRVGLVDLRTRHNNPLLARPRRIIRVAARSTSEFAIATEDGAVEYCRARSGGRPTVSLMFRVPNVSTLAMGHEGTIFASDREGKIWFGRPGRPAFVVPAAGRVLGLTFLEEQVLVVTRERFRIFDLTSGEAVLQDSLPTEIATCAPASKRYLFCTLPRATQVLRVIDLEDKVLYPLEEGHRGPVTRALELSTGEVASVGGDRRLLGWRGGSLAWSQPIKGKTFPNLLSVGRERDLWGTVGGTALQLFYVKTGQGASFFNNDKLRTTAAARRLGDVVAGFSDGSVTIVEDVGVGTGTPGLTWDLFPHPVLQIVALEEGGFVACSRDQLAFVGENVVVRATLPNLVHPTLCARGGVVFAGTAVGDIHAWSDAGAALGLSAGAHKGGVTALYQGPKYLVSGGRGAELGVWTFGREEGFQRVERLGLRRSGERANYLGPAARLDEFFLGSSRGAVVRCRFRD